MALRNVLRRVLALRRASHRPLLNVRRSLSSRAAVGGGGAGGAAVEDIPSLFSQIKNEFTHGSGAFSSVAVVGLVSAAMALERLTSSDSADHVVEHVALPNHEQEHGGGGEVHDAIVVPEEEGESEDLVKEEDESDAGDGLEVQAEKEDSSETVQEGDAPEETETPVGVSSESETMKETDVSPEIISAVEASQIFDKETPLVSESVEATTDVAAVEQDGVSAEEQTTVAVETEDEDECPFCVFMKAGGCREEFIGWQKCIDSAREGSRELHEHCLEQTLALKTCMEANEDYYAPALQATSEDEETAPTVESKDSEVEKGVDVDAVVASESATDAGSIANTTEEDVEIAKIAPEQVNSEELTKTSDESDIVVVEDASGQESQEALEGSSDIGNIVSEKINSEVLFKGPKGLAETDADTSKDDTVSAPTDRVEQEVLSAVSSEHTSTLVAEKQGLDNAPKVEEASSTKV